LSTIDSLEALAEVRPLSAQVWRPQIWYKFEVPVM
jgi:hypothetical protein